jgi:hypothetical protein
MIYIYAICVESLCVYDSVYHIDVIYRLLEPKVQYCPQITS